MDNSQIINNPRRASSTIIIVFLFYRRFPVYINYKVRFFLVSVIIWAASSSRRWWRYLCGMTSSSESYAVQLSGHLADDTRLAAQGGEEISDDGAL